MVRVTEKSTLLLKAEALSSWEPPHTDLWLPLEAKP